MRIRRSEIGLFLVAILGANIQFTNANAATFASGTPCEVIVSDISNLTYSHNSGPRQCTYTFSYNATVRTITLPTNLVSATITLTGARGGQGGPRTNAGGQTAYASEFSYVGIYAGTIPSPNNKQIEIHTGAKGGDGNNDSTALTGLNPGPVGGSSSYSSGVGGSGGGTGGNPSVNQGGTGGSGGAATVAVIDSIPIFAGGGGGTGGSNRKDSDTNLAGGVAQTSATSLTGNSNGGSGGSYPHAQSNTSATASGGGGGGGGGGSKGGSNGAGAWNNSSNSSRTFGGYPGSNGTTYSLTATSNSHTQSISSATGSLGGVAVIVLIYKGTTTATLSLPAGNLVYRQATTISDTSTVAGKITFRANGKILPGCKNRVARANVVVTCSYKPSTRNSVTITATLDPTDPDFIGTVSVSAQFQVGNRTGPRTR
jgi:hypothetical protein